MPHVTLSRRTRSLAFGLLALLLACAPPLASQPPEATVAPTEAATVASATHAPSATPRPTAAPIRLATSTPDPGVLNVDWTSTSPDGQWTATAANAGLNTGGYYYVRLRVEGAVGAQVWTAVEEWRPPGLGFTLPGLVRWSADGQRLYFTNVPHPDGCSMFVNGGDLYVLDLASGQVTELMPAQALWVALSPDETRAAYIGYGERGLILRDLATGQEQSVDVPRPTEGAPLGAIQWSPDGTALVLTTAAEPCLMGNARSILHVDLATGAVRTLVEADRRGLVTTAWPVESRVMVQDSAGAKWWLELEPELMPRETLVPAQTVVPVASPTYEPLPTAYPVTWEEARALILSGDVFMVSQFHDLTVYLMFRDNSRAVTKEPSIDEVIRVIEACGDPCYGISIGTE